ncbi:crotonase/enoyl-CoA hydratase family protein [Ornithinimicrobium avium]|uniref:Crotonase/enoyl-CoA hydratase family protein n=1 Tax=Ornithinimicrobium avium TaxID=2283195 RepID=A0A345NPT5_9MICO|nr:crotonase/enoyl-CoA hydratase family protein [Ornithinimicrobium avium]AXH97043.1 crotonase/enoyl-CoA hydratase family protein [Ornithinimicrobium avium]
MRTHTFGSHLTSELVDGVAHVRLARPDKLNALTLEMLDGLVAAARSLRGQADVRAVVLSGEGDAFCAGLDLRAALRQPRGIATRFVPLPWTGTNVFQEACWAWRRLPVPVVAAVHGHCLGAGLQLALGADLRVSTPDAQWSVREARWGLVPDMSGTRSLVELVGLDVAKELTLTARTVGGEEAHRLGLVTRVAADPQAAALDLVGQMVAHDPVALARGKRLLDRAVGASVRATFARERWAQLRLLARMDRSGLPGGSSQPARPRGAAR